MLDWSYELLSEPERTLLLRLAVFAGGWTLDAADALAADSLPADSSLAASTSECHSSPPSDPGKPRTLDLLPASWTSRSWPPT